MPRLQLIFTTVLLSVFAAVTHATISCPTAIPLYKKTIHYKDMIKKDIFIKNDPIEVSGLIIHSWFVIKPRYDEQYHRYFNACLSQEEQKQNIYSHIQILKGWTSEEIRSIFQFQGGSINTKAFQQLKYDRELELRDKLHAVGLDLNTLGLTISFARDMHDAVHKRMIENIDSQIAKLHSSGKEHAVKTISDAKRQATVIRANAYKEAKIIRGATDAVAAEVYAQAFNKDPEFYSFLQSLKAYKSIFSENNNRIVIDPYQFKFFRHFTTPMSK